tara:strand:+ start:3778 stop:4026 length:249 start_codon:yes stop_codon:yes gene_type:complete
MRGQNCSFFHYYVNEAQEDGTWSDPIFFTTMKQLKEKYGISRASVYRLLIDPECSTRFPHKITKQFIHISALPFIQNNQESL